MITSTKSAVRHSFWREWMTLIMPSPTIVEIFVLTIFYEAQITCKDQL